MAAKDRSDGCEVCGKDLLLYKCKFCGKAFCETHKAPEKHACEGMAEYRREKELGTVVRPGKAVVNPGEGTRRRPSRLRLLFNSGALAVKLLSVFAVAAAMILAFVLLLGYVDSQTPTYSFSIPVTNASGAVVYLVNYKNATDPTYEALMAFLAADKTIQAPYDYPNNTCADFARTLHDNAEAKGIRSGFVAIEFFDIAFDYSVYDNGDGKFVPPVPQTSAGHAVNVFNTTDRGLIYVDASSQSGFTGEIPVVRIAYLVEGLELNGIDIAWAGNTSYAFYESYKKEHLDLISDQREYYEDREALNTLLLNSGTATEEMRQENQRLNDQATALNLRESQMGPFYYPPGVVKEFQVYW